MFHLFILEPARLIHVLRHFFHNLFSFHNKRTLELKWKIFFLSLKFSLLLQEFKFFIFSISKFFFLFPNLLLKIFKLNANLLFGVRGDLILNLIKAFFEIIACLFLHIRDPVFGFLLNGVKFFSVFLFYFRANLSR